MTKAERKRYRSAKPVHRWLRKYEMRKYLRDLGTDWLGAIMAADYLAFNMHIAFSDPRRRWSDIAFTPEEFRDHTSECLSAMGTRSAGATLRTVQRR